MTGVDEPGDDASAQAFMRALVSPARALGARRELGTTLLARQLGLADDQLGGHWCSRCQGLWYGCMLEVECPSCGNRHG
jgi:hypothetical protein